MKADLIICNANQVVTPVDAAERPKIRQEMADLRVIPDGAVAVAGERILWVGPSGELEKNVKAGPSTRRISARGKTVLPGLVDPHTHLVFAGSREHELELKLKGVPYLEILAQGGGILSTVRATRAASQQELVESGIRYARQMLSQGTTTAEAKSGYGLSTTDELKLLAAIKEIDASQPLDLVPTFLGAHAVPPEYKGNPEGYVDLVLNEMLPQAAPLARYCDVFCEQGVFSSEQARRILQAAQALGMNCKLHADEITPLGGAELAAELGAVSADHLLAVSDEGIRLMAERQVTAVLLPGTTFYLKEPQYAPARKLIEAGVPVALATDFNPGSCPNNSLQLVMSIACLYLNMTPAEVVTAVTINAAYAIGRAREAGSLEVGKPADIVIFDAPSYQYIPYRIGSNLVETVLKNGRTVTGG